MQMIIVLLLISLLTVDAYTVEVGVDTDGSVEEVGAGTDVELEHGEIVKAGCGLDEDISVKVAKKFGCILKSSKQFDQAVLSGDRKSVLLQIVKAVGGSLGLKPAEALAHCLASNIIDGSFEAGSHLRV